MSETMPKGPVYGGIDPGKDGSLAVIYPDNSVAFFDVPTAQVEMTKKTKAGNQKTKRVYLPAEMVRILRNAGLTSLTIERAQAMPAFVGGRRIPQGAVSAFASGEGFGLWQGILAALEIPYQIVSAVTWKARMLEGQPKTKEAVIPAIEQLYPRAAPLLRGPKGRLLIDRADALFLAHYGRVLAGRGTGE